MSLPAYQQQVLDTIESVLQKREPRLASMFAMFTRLNTNEGIPRTERLDAAPRWVWRRRRHVNGARPVPRASWRAGAVRALLLAPLVAMLVVFALLLGMNASRGSCTSGYGPRDAVAGPSHVRSCPPLYGFRAFNHSP